MCFLLWISTSQTYHISKLVRWLTWFRVPNDIYSIRLEVQVDSHTCFIGNTLLNDLYYKIRGESADLACKPMLRKEQEFESNIISEFIRFHDTEICAL